MNKPYKLSFDGCGLNNANDPYKRRLFTASRADYDQLYELGKYIERATNNHEKLLETLTDIVNLAEYAIEFDEEDELKQKDMQRIKNAQILIQFLKS